ncbi:serine/threonine protein kinase [Nonomuraea sp. WAC 01424]|uniref:serine/threonine-protein kinase n=1 Tax=Nonomuraea sp. WAC 01424 TaxID=2203200 RepID=UPI000F770A2C|nr:serine/threonine-protein kinase [Nonomuraea sp. WAC 01424]RSM94845.1 serine/threonine protein kinase [Nonomuraea sp. WAC 01424]
MGRSAGTPLKPEDPPEIGPYELVSRLGSGGMGTVYLARGADRVKVALKAIRRDFTADPVYRARFHEEVSNARKVASFCTARVLDHGEDRGVLYLVTEYIDGISLENQLIEHGALPPSVLHSAAVGVAAALTAIHAAGLVHRDLKPANVMLTLAGPRVIDFGLARSTHVASRHTNAGMVMGTPGWIAPEQVFEGHTSPAGDVFAWGSLIAYAGLGGHPFGEGDAYVMAARARTAPPDLRGLPAPLDRLVAAAIHPDPARRPAAKQLLLELVGAADEPAAQLAASKHLTNAWNPSEFPPLHHMTPPAERTGPRPPMPSPVDHTAQRPPMPPPAERTGPRPPMPPSAERPHQAPPPSAADHAGSRTPMPPSAERPHQAQMPPMPSAPEHTGARPPQAPSAAESTGPRPPMPAPAERPGPRAPQMPAPAEHPGPRPPLMPPPVDRTGNIPLPHHQATGQSPLSHHQTTGQGPLPPHTTGQGPLPGYVPPRRRRSTFTGCVTALVIAIVLLVVVLATLAWIFRSSAIGEEGPVKDGTLTFAVTNTKCPKAAKSATHRSCQVMVKVNNVGQEARVLYPGQQKLIDKDEALHGGNKLLDKGGAEITSTRIAPSQSFTGTLVFDLPRSIEPAGLEVHDSDLSPGARLALG